MIKHFVIIRFLGTQDYLLTWRAMQQFTNQRNENSFDEIWIVEHPPVFTQGQNGKADHILDPGEIPVIPVDRGGQVTYHGPGQLVVYILMDIQRKAFTIRETITALEHSVIQLLNQFNIPATARCKAPGVYIENKKICSIGLRVRRGCTFHGLALNVSMDLSPFKRINPCGCIGLEMTQLSEIQAKITLQETAQKLMEHLITNLGYNASQHRYAEPGITDEVLKASNALLVPNT